MKAKLEFDLDDYDKDDERLLKLAMKSQDMAFAFESVHQRIWRPYYKHGYNGKLQDIIDRNHVEKENDENGFYVDDENDVLDAIELLHELYREVLEEYGIYDVLD